MRIGLTFSFNFCKANCSVQKQFLNEIAKNCITKGMSKENNAKEPSRPDANLNRYMTCEMQAETTGNASRNKSNASKTMIGTLFVALVKVSN